MDHDGVTGGPPGPESGKRGDAPRVLRWAADAQLLHEALVLVRALENVTSAAAGAGLVEVGLATGHTPTCVARELLHLAFPATHGAGSHELAEAVRRRWRWPLHRLRHPDSRAGSRVWTRVRGAGGTVPSPHPRLN